MDHDSWSKQSFMPFFLWALHPPSDTGFVNCSQGQIWNKQKSQRNFLTVEEAEDHRSLSNEHLFLTCQRSIKKKEELTDGINRHAVSGVLNEFFDSSFENSNHDVKLVTTCMALRNWWRTSPKHMFYSRYTIHRHNLLVVDYPYILLIFRRLGISGHCKRSSTQRFDNRFLSIQSGNHTGGGTTSRFRISPDTYIWK